MPLISEFSDRLKEFLILNNLTTEVFGKNIGTNGSAVRHWLNEANSVSLSNAVLVADYFNCSLEYLFGKTDKLVDFTIQSQKPFYEQINKYMQDKKISRYRICLDLKKSHGHFDKWKAGADPNIETVNELAEYFGITLDALIGRES